MRATAKASANKASRFLTLLDVQSYLGIKSRKTILKYVKSGDLTAFKIGGTRWRFALEDVRDFLKAHRISRAVSAAISPAGARA